MDDAATRSVREGEVAWRQAAGVSALIAAAVCLFIGTMLVLSVRDERRLQPLNSPEIAAMKAELADRPNDEGLKTRIRDRDEALRRGFFQRHAFVAHGGWLLVGAGAALMLALKSFATLTKRPGNVLAERRDPWEENRMARWGVGVSGLLIVGVAGAWAVWQRPELPAGEPQTLVVQPVASRDELARNWVSFRGLNGDGIVAQGAMPERWDGTTGEGIAWKKKIPLPGHGSPVIFGENVFISGSDGDAQELYCFSTRTGEMKWRGAIPRASLQKPTVFDDTGFAASTPVTDGARVYAIFAGGDVAAFDYTGRKIWSRSIGTPESQYGYAASLALSDGKVIVQWDQGGAPEDGKSALICLDGVTGKQVWKTPRPVANGWTSPIVADGQVYTCGVPWVIGYSAADGKELWRAKLMEGDVAPSPVWHSGVLYVANDRAVAAAIKTDGTGDVTASKVLWTNKEVTLPDIVSPLTDGRYLLLTHGAGEVNCLNVADGKIVWTKALEVSMNASPILAGKQVCLIDKDGTAHLFGLQDQFDEIRTCKLGEEVSASPAVAGGRMYVRAKEHLYCIGK